MKVFQPSALGRGVQISATGAYLPTQVVTNDDLVAEGAPLSPAEIVRLSGIETRRRAAPHEATSDLAIAACRAALERAGVEPSAVDRLVLATVSPDHVTPSAACLVQHGLGLRHVPAFDLTASCSGFLFALDAAARAVVTSDDTVLACAADVRSRWLDPTDRATCALFGDGAGAALVAPGPVGRGLVAIGLGCDGAGARSVYVPAGGSRLPASAATVQARQHTIRMSDGPQVYLQAIQGMLDVADALLAAVGMGRGDVFRVVPHQANRRLLSRLARRAGWTPEQVVVNVDRFGNMSGASCAVAFDELLCGPALPPGAPVLLLAAGAGHTAGGALYIP